MFTIYIPQMKKSLCCKDGETVLSALENAGAAGKMCGCRGGGCGVCKLKLLQGKVIKALPMSSCHVSKEDEAQGVFLACCVYPKSNITIQLFEGSL